MVSPYGNEIRVVCNWNWIIIDYGYCSIIENYLNECRPECEGSVQKQNSKKLIQLSMLKYYLLSNRQLIIFQISDARALYSSKLEHRESAIKRDTLSKIISSAGLGQALVRSGWMMLAVLGVNHAFSPAQTEELGLTTVAILKMWPFTVLVLVSLVLTAALLTVSLAMYLCVMKGQPLAKESISPNFLYRIKVYLNECHQSHKIVWWCQELTIARSALKRWKFLVSVHSWLTLTKLWVWKCTSQHLHLCQAHWKPYGLFSTYKIWPGQCSYCTSEFTPAYFSLCSIKTMAVESWW